MAGSITLADYTSQASTLQDWIQEIAPKYFDFEQTNNYRTGLFGYVNEVMSNVTEDTFNAVTISRREFYPTQAQYVNSIYRMGALHELNAPMSIPARVRAVLTIREADILPYLQTPGDTYTISDETIFSAGNIPFMLDYPVIVSGARPDDLKSRLDALGKDSMAYTARYNREAYTNDLDSDHRVYLQNRVIPYNDGSRLILISCFLRQVQKEVTTFTINKNSQIDIVTEDIQIDGKIASFEVFYQESGSEVEYQLKKILAESSVPTEKFVEYKLIDENTLRLSFPANNYFTPAYNSTVRVVVYTTLGEDGNFDEYKGNFSCTLPESGTFRTTRNIVIDGTPVGASFGGVNREELEQFRKDVIYAYATNETICTDHDLQVYWDRINDDTNNKILFYKQRDDVFQRLYGAYMLLKDEDDNVIPTNTLTIEANQGIIDSNGTLSEDTDFDNYYISSDRLIIKPGRIFRYLDNSIGYDSSYRIRRDKSLSLNLDNSNYEQICDYISKALDNVYSTDPTKPVTKESSYSYIIRNKTQDEVMLDVTTYLKNFYNFDFPYGQDIRYYASFSGARTIDTLENAVIWAASGEESYIGEYIYVEESNMYYVVNEDKELTPVGEYTALTRVRLSYFLFANPYLISVMKEPNAIAYYLNSVDRKLIMDYDRIVSGTESIYQFIINSMTIERNAMMGENFYKYTVVVMPNLEQDGFAGLVVEDLNKDDEANMIRVPNDGYVSSLTYEPYTKGRKVRKAGWKEATDDGPGVFATIMIKNENRYDSYKIRVSSNTYPSAEGYGENLYYYGYDLEFDVSSSFKANDVVAIKKDRDLSRIKMILMFNPDESGFSTQYVPFVLEDYDSSNGYYTFRAYIATDDEITLNETFHITNGLFTTSSTVDTNGKTVYFDEEVNETLAYIDVSDTLDMRLAIFLKYDNINNPDLWQTNTFVNGKNFDPEYPNTNSKHFLDGKYFADETGSINNSHTFTNEYKIASDEDPFYFIHSIPYIRSTLVADYEPSESTVDPDVLALLNTYKEIKSRIQRTFTLAMIAVDERTDLTEQEKTLEKDKLYNQLVYDLNTDKVYEYQSIAYSLNEAIRTIEEGINSLSGGITTFTMKSVPMIKAEWLKSTSNVKYLTEEIESNYEFVNTAYTYLENNFGIDMKFYNTYGRSRFYVCGIGEDLSKMQQLDRTNCTFNFGVRIDQTTSVDTFSTRFKQFVSEYIESLNDIEAEGRPLYIMDLISAIQAEFDEIIYLEYYGMNNYDYSVQKVVSNYENAMSSLMYNEYTPEFINTNGLNHDFGIEPAVNITFLTA